MDTLNAIFGQGRDLNAGQECARAVLIFLYGFVAVRVLRPERGSNAGRRGRR
jgi:hypothetical protein